MKRLFLLLSFCNLLVASLLAQPGRQTPGGIRTLEVLCREITDNGWYFIDESVNLPIDSFLTWYGPELGTGYFDEWKPTRQLTDANGFQHIRFQQFHKGVPVYGAYFDLHGWKNDVRVAHGQPALGLDLIPLRGVSKELALQVLLETSKEYVLAEGNPEWESELQAETANPDTSWAPEGTLYYSSFDEGYQLAYRFEVRTLVPDDLREIWIDANKKKVLRDRSLRYACQGVQGQARTSFYGERTLDLQERTFPHYDYVLETCEDEGTQIHTKFYKLNSFGEPRSWSWISSISHKQTDWQNHAQHATTAHWAASQAWNYFQSVHDWNGPDGEGGEVRILVDWEDGPSSSEGGAWYVPDGKKHYLYLGQQDGLPMATLDIVGHEFAHGLIRSTAGLAYERESGALNEAFADMFGVLVAQHTLREQTDWEIGRPLGTLRSLKEPLAYGQPDFYGEAPFWIDPSPTGCAEPQGAAFPAGNDYCGVHTNSGVGGHWFYLMVEGGEKKDIEINGIGLQKGGEIIFHALTRYLMPYSDYTEARMATIQAAIDLYGICAEEVAQVRNAWSAVGVGLPNEQMCVSLNGPAEICLDEEDGLFIFEATTLKGATFNWVPLPAGVEYYTAGDFNEQLIIRSMADTITDLILGVWGTFGQMQANTQMNLSVGICKNGQPREGPVLPADSLHWAFYPNPNDGQLQVYVPLELLPAQISLYDAMGRKVEAFSIQSFYTNWQLDHLSDGSYFVKLEGNQGSDMRKLILLR